MNSMFPDGKGDHSVDADILARWSPRSFDGSALDVAALSCLFEAARWAPSAFNAQPWRFVYGLRNTAEWDALLDTLLPFNASWAASASALIYILSDTQVARLGTSATVSSAMHSFDAGAAWSLLALQATKLGLYTHAMAGFDRARAAEATGAGTRFHVEVAVAVGRLGDPGVLPDTLRAREGPSARQPLAALAFNGRMTTD
jgi:nitroreductase